MLIFTEGFIDLLEIYIYNSLTSYLYYIPRMFGNFPQLMKAKNNPYLGKQIGD